MRRPSLLLDSRRTECCKYSRARVVRGDRTLLLNPNTDPKAVETSRIGAGGALPVRAEAGLHGCGVLLEAGLSEGGGGVVEHGSGRHAAGPSPPVHGPSACTRRRLAAALRRRAMLACASMG